MKKNTYKKGDLVKIRPEWQDTGDEKFEWVCLDDEDKGRVCIQPKLGMSIDPHQVVSIDMIEHA